MIAIRVLGPVEATVDGAPADLGGPRQRSVLARLVAEQGRAVSADRLIEDLYADEPPPRALAALQAYVSHLRRALEPDRPPRAAAQVLVTSPPGYALRLRRDAVDAWAFEDQVNQAAGLDDPAAVQAQLSAALASWRGPAFPEFDGLAWADLEASRLEELRLTATERRAEAALRLGRAAQVTADLSRLTAEHPLREEAWRLLALGLYQSGRQGDALAALRRARAQLADDLGVDPGPALRALERDILAQAPHLSAPQPPVSPATAPATPATGPASPVTGPVSPATAAAGSMSEPPASPGAAAAGPLPEPPPPARPEPFVGRAAEIAQVMRAAAEAAGGRSRLVLVAGEAGTGKTALVSHVWGRLAADGWTVAAGRCPEDEGAPPGWPWAEALRQLAGSIAPADLVPLRPLLEERLPRAGGPSGDDDPPTDDDPPAARFRLHQAISSCLEAVGRDRPFLVILDDLHRADGETLAILVSVCAALTTSKVLLVATYRPADAGDALTGCLATLAEREPARITLAGLDDGAAAELIRATCHRAVDDPTVRVLVERTGANAFFLKEMSRLVDAEGALAATTEVPAGVRDVLQRRIARLPAGAQSILRQAAVIGTEASVDVLADVSGAADDALLDAVEAGLITGLVTEPAAGRIRFSHALVRDTLYGGLSRLRRSRLHARAAQAIERRSPGEVAALAHHFTRAGTDPGAAARYSRLAAEQAEQRFAYVEAAQLWEQALACLDQASTAAPRDRLELLLGLVRALSQAGQLARARSWRRDAIQAALPLGDPALLAQVITAFDVPMLWSAKEYGVTEQDLVDTVEQTLSRLPDGDQPLRSRLLATLAFELDGAGSARGDQASAEGVEMARRLGDRGTLIMAINGRFIQTFRGDGLDERLRLGAELLALGELPVTAEALAHLMLMVGYSGTGDFSAADRHADQAERITARYDLPASRAGFYRAMRAGLAGDPSAEERYRQAADQMSPLGMWQHGAALSVLGRFCLLAGQGRLAEIAPELEPLYHYPPWSPVIAELYALTLAAGGQPAEARAVAGRPGPIRRDTFWLSMVAVRGLLALAIGDRERAESSYQALQPYAGRPAGAETGVMTLGPAAQILGDLARYLDLPGAEDHYRQALALGERAGVRAWAEAARQRLPLTPAQH